ncbi:asparagine synthase (glutamine-hydrolyzing) [Lutimonas vermicola]|uniref:asparagine synthase (glutamine-hydrolyzing) n=1 Tax=Lutimonas vermicola TaxID=414288 RepID=A0ABU9L696_9FLAO
MCGIAGFYPNRTDRISTKVLRRMLTRIKHRGPDESGIYVSDQVALGSVRLSIIDLVSGTMPISNKDRSLWIVFNGEIFNYIELKEGLIRLGHTFETNSDTEVVLHLYEEYGKDFLNMLNGQFAISIWDKKKEELFLARDRVGIRPLYYTEVNDTFVFASEIKALMEFPGIQPKMSAEALAEYFTFWTSLSPKTIFQGIYEVPPGTYMRINSKERKIIKYWQLPIYKQDDHKYSNVEEAAKDFEKIFSKAVKLRLRADVPVAAYLSGGIDSSVTTSFIKKISPENLKTFSIGFTEKDYDETTYQNIAVKYFDTEHASITCSPEDIAQNFKDVVWHTEAPLLRTAPVPMSLLAKNVKDHNIKVVITGEGADELLGGYNIFKETKIRRFWAKDPNSKYRPLLLKKLYPYLPQMTNASSNMLKMFFGYKLNETDSPVYSHLLRWNNTSRINKYLSDSYKEKIKGYDPIRSFEKEIEGKLEGLDSLAQAQWIELNLFMSGYLLSSQGDRMAMANSVEGRYPFLDHKVIEFCMHLSPDLKLNGLNEKYLLKKMMKNRMPNEILERSKQAYRAPIKSAFDFEKLPIYLKEMLSEHMIEKSGIFNTGHVTRLIKIMNTNKQVSEIDNMALTGILSVQILNDLFVNRSTPELKEEDLLQFDKIVID